MSIFDGRYFVHDSIESSISIPQNDGVEKDDDGFHFYWDEQPVVELNNQQWTQHFNTDKFYKIDTVVAKELKQKYVIDNELYTFKKIASELKKAQWSLDNSPYTLTHPDQGHVRSVDQIHGFYRNPRFDKDEKEQIATLYLPINDDKALDFIEKYQDISVGFYNRLEQTDEEGVDAIQTDMFYDHVASVKNGRCSGENGCGLNIDSLDVDVDVKEKIQEETQNGMIGHMNLSTSNVLDRSRESCQCQSDSSDCGSNCTCDRNDNKKGSNCDCGCTCSNSTNNEHRDSEGNYLITNDYRDEDNKYYAISPSENNGEDSPSYPITNCSDARDAWDLRNNGDYSISVEDLKRRIKRRAGKLNCDLDYFENSENNKSNDLNSNMSKDQKQNDNQDPVGIDLGIDDFNVDGIAERHEGVKELVDEKEQLEEKLEEIEDTVDEKKEKIEDLQETVDEYRKEEKQEIADDVTEIVDKWDEEKLIELELDELKERKELAEEIASEVSDYQKDSEEKDKKPKVRERRLDLSSKSEEE